MGHQGHHTGGILCGRLLESCGCFRQFSFGEINRRQPIIPKPQRVVWHCHQLLEGGEGLVYMALVEVNKRAFIRAGQGVRTIVLWRQVRWQESGEEKAAP